MNKKDYLMLGCFLILAIGSILYTTNGIIDNIENKVINNVYKDILEYIRSLISAVTIVFPVSITGFYVYFTNIRNIINWYIDKYGERTFILLFIGFMFKSFKLEMRWIEKKDKKVITLNNTKHQRLFLIHLININKDDKSGF